LGGRAFSLYSFSFYGKVSERVLAAADDGLTSWPLGTLVPRWFGGVAPWAVVCEGKLELGHWELELKLQQSRTSFMVVAVTVVVALRVSGCSR
jgi:hypothetical protein